MQRRSVARTGQIRCALMRRTAIISCAGRLLLTCTPRTAVASGGRASSRRRLPRPRMASRRLALLRGAGGTAGLASPMPLSRRDERDTSSRLDFRDTPPCTRCTAVVGGVGRAHLRVL